MKKKFVKIYKLHNDGSQQTLATCTLVDTSVECIGDEIFVRNLLEKGTPNYLGNSPETLFPKEGLLFLENLAYVFRSGYLNASKVQEG